MLASTTVIQIDAAPKLVKFALFSYITFKYHAVKTLTCVYAITAFLTKIHRNRRYMRMHKCKVYTIIYVMRLFDYTIQKLC